jgi:predicted Fe-S protein YdhL (DUF1289 family)
MHPPHTSHPPAPPVTKPVQPCVADHRHLTDRGCGRSHQPIVRPLLLTPTQPHPAHRRCVHGLFSPQVSALDGRRAGWVHRADRMRRAAVSRCPLNHHNGRWANSAAVGRRRAYISPSSAPREVEQSLSRGPHRLLASADRWCAWGSAASSVKVSHPLTLESCRFSLLG